jgi:hypothetical protein
MGWNIHRIDPLTGKYGEIVNGFSFSRDDRENMESAVSYARNERHRDGRHHYVVSNGLCTVYDSREA